MLQHTGNVFDIAFNASKHCNISRPHNMTYLFGSTKKPNICPFVLVDKYLSLLFGWRRV